MTPPDINPASAATQLQQAALDHNWDDGLALPTELANHPHCDLGVAMLLFWLAEGTYWYAKTSRDGEHNQEWRTFCSALAQRITSGHYKLGESSFRTNLGAAQKAKFRSQGVPEIFLTDVVGTAPAPDW